MIVILGLVILIAAAIVGVAGVLGNAGTAHPLTHDFSVFGYHVTGSTGTLFLYGLVVGAAGMLGLTLLLAGARRTSRRGSTARRELEQSRRDTAAVSRQRDDLVDQRAAARAYGADQPLNHSPSSERPQSRPDDWRSRLHIPGRQQGAATAPEPLSDHPSLDEDPPLAVPKGAAD